MRLKKKKNQVGQGKFWSRSDLNSTLPLAESYLASDTQLLLYHQLIPTCNHLPPATKFTAHFHFEEEKKTN